MADCSLESLPLPLEVRARLAELELELSEGGSGEGEEVTVPTAWPLCIHFGVGGETDGLGQHLGGRRETNWWLQFVGFRLLPPGDTNYGYSSENYNEDVGSYKQFEEEGEEKEEGSECGVVGLAGSWNYYFQGRGLTDKAAVWERLNSTAPTGPFCHSCRLLQTVTGEGVI